MEEQVNKKYPYTIKVTSWLSFGSSKTTYTLYERDKLSAKRTYNHIKKELRAGECVSLSLWSHVIEMEAIPKKGTLHCANLH